jgi:hypothetical protein
MSDYAISQCCVCKKDDPPQPEAAASQPEQVGESQDGGGSSGQPQEQGYVRNADMTADEASVRIVEPSGGQASAQEDEGTH